MRGVPLLALAVLASSGCGGNDGESTGQTAARAGPLTRHERELVRRTETVVVEYCHEFGLRLAKARGPLSAAEQDRTFDAVAKLLELGRAKPGADIQQGVDVRTAIGDLAENLEGSNCDSRLVERLDRGLALLSPAGAR